MNRLSLAFAAGMVLSVAAAGWLYSETSRLEGEVAALRATPPPECPAPPPAAVVAKAPAPAPTPAPASAPATAPASQGDEQDYGEDDSFEARAERRKRRQDYMAMLLGRREGETEEAYRARLAPLITAGLSEPRKMLEEAREKAEAAAGVTEEQSAKLDEVFDDIYEEAIETTNRAISEGELTPYRRNAVGVLSFIGDLGVILGEAESRVNGVLSPEQRKLLYEAGFDWAEYLAVQVPWESLNPPPPPN